MEREEAAKQTQQIDERLSEKLDGHSETLTELRSEIIAAVSDLTSRSDANDQEHSDALDRLKESVAESVLSLKDQCAGTEAAGAKVLQDATAEIAKVNGELQKQLSRLEGRVFEKIGDT